jgi:hypothetical protein
VHELEPCSYGHAEVKEFCESDEVDDQPDCVEAVEAAHGVLGYEDGGEAAGRHGHEEPVPAVGVQVWDVFGDGAGEGRVGNW